MLKTARLVKRWYRGKRELTVVTNPVVARVRNGAHSSGTILCRRERRGVSAHGPQRRRMKRLVEAAWSSPGWGSSQRQRVAQAAFLIGDPAPHELGLLVGQWQQQTKRWWCGGWCHMGEGGPKGTRVSSLSIGVAGKRLEVRVLVSVSMIGM